MWLKITGNCRGGRSYNPFFFFFLPKMLSKLILLWWYFSHTKLVSGVLVLAFTLWTRNHLKSNLVTTFLGDHSCLTFEDSLKLWNNGNYRICGFNILPWLIYCKIMNKRTNKKLNRNPHWHCCRRMCWEQPSAVGRLFCLLEAREPCSENLLRQ